MKNLPTDCIIINKQTNILFYYHRVLENYVRT